jgi:regulator of nonsense transcripts 2
MMADGLESRKFERKQLFDVALPVRAKARETSGILSSTELSQEPAPAAPSPNHTMAFSLLTKKGNRQQVRTRCYHGSYADLTELGRQKLWSCRRILLLPLQ